MPYRRPIGATASKLADAIGQWKQTLSMRHVPATQRPPAAGGSTAGRRVQTSAEDERGLGTGGLRRMLIALAQRPQGLSDRQLGVRAGLSSSSGSFGTYLAKGRTNGWITGERGCLVISEAGLQALGQFEPLPTGQALLQFWLNQLGNSGAARMLEALAAVYPKAMTKEELGTAANLSHASGSFGTYLSKLRTLELIEGRHEIRASGELFE